MTGSGVFGEEGEDNELTAGVAKTVAGVPVDSVAPGAEGKTCDDVAGGTCTEVSLGAGGSDFKAES